MGHYGPSARRGRCQRMSEKPPSNTGRRGVSEGGLWDIQSDALPGDYYPPLSLQGRQDQLRVWSRSAEH
jgi:hypothetical protein